MDELIAQHGHCITIVATPSKFVQGEITVPVTVYNDDTVVYNAFIRALFTGFLKLHPEEKWPTVAKRGSPMWTPFLELRDGSSCALSEIRLPIYYKDTVSGNDLTNGFWYRVNVFDTYIGESLVLELDEPCADFVFVQNEEYYYAYHDSWEMSLENAGVANQSETGLEITWPTENHKKFVFRGVLFEKGSKLCDSDKFVQIRL